MNQISAPGLRAVHHFAFKCRDAEATRHFYEDILEMPLAMVVIEDDFKSTTGDVCDFAHLFFEMRDGNYIAFFDFGDFKAHQPDPETPLFANHLAIQVGGEDDLLNGKTRLESFGIDVIGPLDHDMIRSIYFWDPNGVRLELAYTSANSDTMQRLKDEASANMQEWISRVARKRAEQAA